LDIEQLSARARAVSPVLLALPFGGVLLAADLLPALAPGSALLTLLSILIWFPTALATFALITWFRDDEWLMAGFVLGLTPIVARLVSDVLTGVDMFASSDPWISLVVRAVVAVPLCGGAVFGARWLTMLISGADTVVSKRSSASRRR
jgi:hypothetical protein